MTLCVSVVWRQLLMGMLTYPSRSALSASASIVAIFVSINSRMWNVLEDALADVGAKASLSAGSKQQRGRDVGLC